jgi:hypothetical protein
VFGSRGEGREDKTKLLFYPYDYRNFIILKGEGSNYTGVTLE